MGPTPEMAQTQLVQSSRAFPTTTHPLPHCLGKLWRGINRQTSKSFDQLHHHQLIPDGDLSAPPPIVAMPGPGPHMMYALGSGQAMMYLSGGRFGPHHCVSYAINAFFGPDMGSFVEWLTSSLRLGRVLGSSVEWWIHDPFYYPLILGFPLSLLYSWASRFLLRKGALDSYSGAPLTVRQSFLLIFAGSLSHFFLDHLFEENGHSSVYTWILSTGWWETRASINPDAVVVISILCTSLIVGFIYIHRVKHVKLGRNQHRNSVKLMAAVAGAYCLWCASQIYLVAPRRPAVGEEADLGILVFLGVFYFLPHWFCILSMNPSTNALDSAQQLPL